MSPITKKARDQAREMREQAAGYEARAAGLPWYAWRRKRRLREKALDLRRIADLFLAGLRGKP